MSDLFSSLTMASRALAAQRMGLDVVGQNVANANTVGYTRRVIDLAAVPPTDNNSAGGGVEVVGVRSARDELLETRLRQEQPLASREGAVADSLSVVEAALGDSGASLDGSLDAFFDAFATLSEDPASSTARQTVLVQGDSLARTFNDLSARLTAASSGADTQIRGTVEQVNDLCSRIATLNGAIASAGGSGTTTLGLKDELNQSIRDLSKFIDVSTIVRADGGVDLAFANGRALVIGNNAYAVETGTNSAGHATLLSGGFDVTDEVTGGQIGGLLHVRDVLVPGYINQLDGLAYELASRVNTLHTSGVDLTGAAGQNFFTPLASSAGAAANLALNGAIAGNPNLVAAGSSSATDNGNARALADLRNTRVLDGGTATFTDAWASLVYRVGQDSSAAKASQTARKEVILQIDSLRDAVSGVSLDEEAMMMMKFQRAYEANARYFTVIDEAISTLLSLGSGR